MIAGAILAALLLAVAGVVFVARSRGAATAELARVSVQELARADEQGRIVLDVRTPGEYAEGHVAGSMLIPLDQLAGRVDELPDDAPIYVICRSGNRSLTASRILLDAGKRDVRDVQGGILAWRSAGLPVAR